MLNNLKKWVFKQVAPESNFNESGSLKGYVIIITGASKGLGLETAKLLSSSGASLVLVSTSKIEYEFGNQTVSFVGNVANYDDCKKIVESTISSFGKVDCLINNAGIFADKPLVKTSISDFKKVIDTNLYGAFNMSKLLVPQMKKKGRGTIINIGSKISHNTNVSANKVTYATSKYALEGFSFALNKELKGTGVRVCCLMPGTIGTFLSRKSKSYLSPFDVAQLIKTVITLGNIDFESIVFKSIKQDI